MNNKYNLEEQYKVFVGTIQEEQNLINEDVRQLVIKWGRDYAKIDQDGSAMIVKTKAGKCKKGLSQLKHITYTYPKFRERMLQEPEIIVKVFLNKDKEKQYKKKKFADVFLEHPEAKFYTNGISMNPWKVGEKDLTHKSVYNMYKGLSVKRVKHDMSKINTFIEIAELSLCNGKKIESDFLLDLVAWQLANPQHKSKIAVLFRGLEGTFKGSFMEVIRGINKHHFIQMQGVKQLVGSFNAVLAYATTVFADEVDLKSQEVADALKNLITEDKIMMEKKQVDAYELDSYINLFCTTNRAGKLELSGSQRRWFCVESDKAYGAKGKDISKHVDLNIRHRAQIKDNDFHAMVLDYLLERAENLPDDWKPWDFMPQTEEELKLKSASLTPKQQWLEESINAGFFLGYEGKYEKEELTIHNYKSSGEMIYRFEDLKMSFLAWAHTSGRVKGRASLNEFKDLLEPLGINFSRPLIGKSQVKSFTILDSRETLFRKFEEVILGKV